MKTMAWMRIKLAAARVAAGVLLTGFAAALTTDALAQEATGRR